MRGQTGCKVGVKSFERGKGPGRSLGLGNDRVLRPDYPEQVQRRGQHTGFGKQVDGDAFRCQAGPVCIEGMMAVMRRDLAAHILPGHADMDVICRRLRVIVLAGTR